MEKTLSVHQKLSEIQVKLNAPKSRKNTFGNYNYRNCEDILEAVKPLLGKEYYVTLTDEIVQFQATHEPMIVKITDSRGIAKDTLINFDRFYIKATATISDGKESVSVSALAREEDDKKGMDGAQVTGASSSYARKYALNGLFAIDDSQDADEQEPAKATPVKYEHQKPVTPVGKMGVYSPILDKLLEQGSITDAQYKVAKTSEVEAKKLLTEIKTARDNKAKSTGNESLDDALGIMGGTLQ